MPIKRTMIPPGNIHPLSTFKRRTPEFVKRLKETGLPEVVTIEGRGELVIQDVAAYEKLLATVDRAEAFLGVRQGLKDMNTGRLMSLEMVGSKLRKRLKVDDQQV